MAVTYGRKKHKQTNILHTVITAVLLCTVFLTMVSYFYKSAEDEAYENLHIQTKQIKDDMQLQLLSDRENLATMANFAAKLYSDGESYNLMFESFKPIGLIENIGILRPDNTFVTKAGTINLDGRISFEEEKKKGEYISGRVPDLTRENYEIIRSAVPIKVGNKVVGILYGVIKLDVIGEKYNNMAKELDAQLFVYDKESGNLVIDTIHGKLGNISFLKDRVYNKGYSYEKMIAEDKGFTSFVSAYTGEDLYVHYSALEDIGWMITLARYESQVFAKTHTISQILFTAFLIMVGIMILYTLVLMASEKRRNFAMACASSIRKLLLEINQQQNNISEALKQVCLFAKSRSAVFFDTDGEDFNYSMPEFENVILYGEERKYFISELFHYAAELHKLNKATVGVMCIKPNEHLTKTNPKFYDFLKNHNIEEISFAAVTSQNNHITILGAVNPQKSKTTRILLEEIAVCFSIAIYNKKHLNKTEIAATTDSLTGASNRVTYKKDLLVFDEMKPEKFSCIYIDVNELHIRNNKYGHAAGDEMLLYIANTLKEVFFGHHIYRMGGDEFLVFVKNTDQEAVKQSIELFIEQLEPMDYHVAIGMSYRTQNSNTEEMVKEAEVRMYEAKAQYYQNKEQQSVSKSEDKGYVQTKTGIREIDAMISVMKEHYNGIYRVSLDTDKAHRILMPAYLGYNENEEHFSKLLTKYIEETVDSDFHRAIMSFLNYDALKRQLLDSKTPKITYKKTNGETVILSVYNLNDSGELASETLWVFAKN
ncbi:MAG: GGDEF domain-containing protein [Clostridia bacterium]|nr:GGDEF domain-containing protein [Clostridia bacterium]MBQ8637378.1 GGDEF domain-containing protein [Clostridia bacterium]